MTRDEYDKMPEREFVKRRWRMTQDATTMGEMTIHKGAEVRVTRKRGGLTVESPTCPHCGVSFVCRRVLPSYLEEIVE